MTEWWLTALCWEELLNLGELNRQALLGNRIRHTVLVIDREWLTPITLAAEDCIAQTIVDLHAAKLILGNELLCLCDCLLDCQAIEVELAITERSNRRVCHYTLFGIEALLAYITTLNQRTYLNAEVLCKRVVTAVVCRNSHDGTCSVTRKYIVAHPHRNLLAGNRVDGI